MEDEELTRRIIGAAIAVHEALGPGFVERLYENALAIELQRRGLRFVRQVDVEVSYAGEPIGMHRLDVVVDDRVIVELKAVSDIPDITFATLRSYMRACGRSYALILFGKPRLEVKRVEAKRRSSPGSPSPPGSPA